MLVLIEKLALFNKLLQGFINPYVLKRTLRFKFPFSVKEITTTFRVFLIICPNLQIQTNELPRRTNNFNVVNKSYVIYTEIKDKLKTTSCN